MKTLTFKISLTDSKPLIWRRFKVTDQYRLDRFHQVIQIVMGWQNSHLHEFEIHGKRYGMILPNYSDEFDPINENWVYLRHFELAEGQQWGYLYDFGDNWTHLLELEKIEEGDLVFPICLEGQQKCPREDAGGIHSYMYFLEGVKDPNHPARELYWIDTTPEEIEFDPDFFGIDEVNKELEKFGKWHQKHPRKKSTPWHRVD